MFIQETFIGITFTVKKGFGENNFVKKRFVQEILFLLIFRNRDGTRKTPDTVTHLYHCSRISLDIIQRFCSDLRLPQQQCFTVMVNTAGSHRVAEIRECGEWVQDAANRKRVAREGIGGQVYFSISHQKNISVVIISQRIQKPCK